MSERKDGRDHQNGVQKSPLFLGHARRVPESMRRIKSVICECEFESMLRMQRRRAKKRGREKEAIKPISIPSPRLKAFAGPSLAPIPSAQTVAQLPTPRSASSIEELLRVPRTSRERRERAESMVAGAGKGAHEKERKLLLFSTRSLARSLERRREK